MKFQRFGNAYAALTEDNELYVVSLYCGNWQPWFHRSGMHRPEQIGMYGHSTPEEAMRAAQAHAEGSE